MKNIHKMNNKIIENQTNVLKYGQLRYNNNIIFDLICFLNGVWQLSSIDLAPSSFILAMWELIFHNKTLFGCQLI